MKTSPCSSALAMRPATGVTSWSASPSRTKPSPPARTSSSSASRSIVKSAPTSTRSTWRPCSSCVARAAGPSRVLPARRPPFFGGTYFPPTGRQGLPSWRQVLDSVDTAYRERRTELEQQAGQLIEHLDDSPGALDDPNEKADPPPRAAPPPTRSCAATTSSSAASAARQVPPAVLPESALAARRRRQAHPRARPGADHAAPHGRGRHLRSARRRLPSLRRRPALAVPHFEKMLYDNALPGADLPGRRPPQRRPVLLPHRGGDARLPAARPPSPRGRLLRLHRRRLGRRGGQVLRLVAGRDRRTPG